MMVSMVLAVAIVVLPLKYNLLALSMANCRQQPDLALSMNNNRLQKISPLLSLLWSEKGISPIAELVSPPSIVQRSNLQGISTGNVVICHNTGRTVFSGDEVGDVIHNET